MGKRILFPFSLHADFHQGYSWTMELASRMDAKLFFFTAVPPDETTDRSMIQNVYHSLLEARGSYLQYFGLAGKNAGTVKTARCIERGDFTWSLLKFVRKTKFDVVVVDPQASVLSPDTLEDVVRHSNGVIVLPDNKDAIHSSLIDADQDAEKKITENFYDILRKSDTYKLPDNFFTTLGRDKGLYNYLQKLFRKNPETHRPEES